MKRYVTGLLLAAVLWIASATPAVAGPIWCEDDPVLHFDWGSIHISTTLFADPASVVVTYTVYSPTAVTVTYPQSGSVPSTVVWVPSSNLPAGTAQIVVSTSDGSSGVTTGTGSAGKFSYGVGTTFTVNSRVY